LAARLARPLAIPGPADELLVKVSREELRPIVDVVQQLGGRHVMLLGVDHRGLDPDATLAVEEVLAVPGGPLVRISVLLPVDGPSYPSITSLVPAAQWDEREAQDLFGIVPAGHPDPRPLVIHEPAADLVHPLLKVRPSQPPAAVPGSRPLVAHGDGVYELPVGPIHAGIIEPGHFRFSAVGESVLHLDTRLFYTHRGLERLVEGRTFDGALAIVERACGVCTVTHATAFSRAVERLTHTTIPPRARMARVLLAELERLYNHVGDLGNICAGVGFHFGTSQLGWQKERLLRVNEGLTGHRYLTGTVAPGGLRLELDPDGLASLADSVHDVDRQVRAIVRRLVRSESLMGRLHGTGIVDATEVRRLGAVGVAARASGSTADVRRDRPADGYQDVDVALVTQAAGDVAARFHVRAQEAVVSAGLIRDLATRLPGGPVRVPIAGEPEPGGSTLASAEGPRGASWVWLMAGPGGRVERLHLRSGSFANWPLVAAAVPGNLVPDFPLINKSFELCYACTDR
jgi:Ni,Fe-hydrogenase III large subunit/Ni,Fe-hydrogenase III component G